MTEPQIIFENSDFVVINKPSGLMVHGVRVSAKKAIDEEKHREPTLVDWLLPRYPEIASVGDDPVLRPGIVHRLDKETSGVMLVARTQTSFEYLKSLFQSHAIQKTYFAITAGTPKKIKGVIDNPIGIKNGTLKRSIHVDTMAKPAITEYEVLAKGTESSFIKVQPKTGRTHQIRVHLASIGCPILGDHLYGGKIHGVAAPRLMLHASAIEFSDDRGQHFVFEAELPETFKQFYPQLHIA